MKDMITFSIEDNTCHVRSALKVIKGKWKIPILWVLAQNGTLRYNELKKSVIGITNMMLASSLKELEQNGLVHRVQYNKIPPHVDYSLTESGKEVIQVLAKLEKWAEELMRSNNNL